MVYALFPEANVSIHVIHGKNHENVVFAVGKSVLDRTCQVNIGTLLLEFGGGGHANAGTCQIARDAADDVREKLLRALVGRETPGSRVAI